MPCRADSVFLQDFIITPDGPVRNDDDILQEKILPCRADPVFLQDLIAPDGLVRNDDEILQETENMRRKTPQVFLSFDSYRADHFPAGQTLVSCRISLSFLTD